MTMYRAVVKYEVGADPRVKLASLRDGLSDIAIALVTELGATCEQVDGWLADALAAAESELEHAARE